MIFHHISPPRVANIDNNYKITISADNRSFHIEEPIIINYKIKNTDSVPKTLCFKKFDPEPNWELHKKSIDPSVAKFAEDTKRRLSGKVYWQFRIDVRKDEDAYSLEPVTFLCLEFSGESPPPRKQDFATLSPGESYNLILNLLNYIYKTNVFAKEGIYKVRIWYENLLEGVELGLSAEKGYITSDWILFRIT